MSKVALIKCESYDYDEVKKSVEKGIALLVRYLFIYSKRREYFVKA